MKGRWDGAGGWGALVALRFIPRAEISPGNESKSPSAFPPRSGYTGERPLIFPIRYPQQQGAEQRKDRHGI